MPEPQRQLVYNDGSRKVFVENRTGSDTAPVQEESLSKAQTVAQEQYQQYDPQQQQNAYYNPMQQYQPPTQQQPQATTYESYPAQQQSTYNPPATYQASTYMPQYNTASNSQWNSVQPATTQQPAFNYPVAVNRGVGSTTGKVDENNQQIYSNSRAPSVVNQQRYQSAGGYPQAAQNASRQGGGSRYTPSVSQYGRNQKTSQQQVSC
eukprot:GHVU01137490.1.p1 GENE.GHVU01137490.1~~GHVU01137490.1.p1  ORF type:complete len:224 (+),score=44.90 GHVU01137490.1:52-672(+)